jgi:spermidine synthase
MRVQKNPAAPATPYLTIGLRRFLYFTAAITGAAILVVEILGAKMLSPYVGTSHFVWTAQIAVTLLSLATGYYLGGRLVDRSQTLGRLYACILIAAAYLCLTVYIVEPVAYWCLQFRLALGALLASAFLYFIPLTLLAVTGPYLVRVLASSLLLVGGQVGRLSAISTLGSVSGTVLIGYVLIPYLPNSMTMFLTGGGLMLLAAVYFFIWGKKSSDTPGVLLGILIGLLVGMAGLAHDRQTHFGEGEQIFRSNSNFGQLQVLRKADDDDVYLYLNDYLTQNGYDTKEKKSIYQFTYLLHGLAEAYAPKVEDVLCIGMGVGIVPMQFAREGKKVDVVEINPAVVPVAEKYFDFDRSKLNLHIGDGREWLNETHQKFDAVILDAFLGDSSPSHLMTREAFGAMQRVLKPGGVLVINSFGDFTEGKDFFVTSLHKTLAVVFKNVRIHAIRPHGNIYFVATDQPAFRTPVEPDFASVHSECRDRVIRAFREIQEVDGAHGRVLTDDYNPVDFYDALNREQTRRGLVVYMQRE